MESIIIRDAEKSRPPTKRLKKAKKRWLKIKHTDTYFSLKCHCGVELEYEFNQFGQKIGDAWSGEILYHLDRCVQAPNIVQAPYLETDDVL